jgi:fibronectin type 3 domain-containing protein
VPLTTPALAPTPTDGHPTTVTTTAITFSWTDNANNEDGFQIFRSVNQGTFTLLTSVPANASPAPSTVMYTDPGLTPGTHYDYHIQAFNLAGYSDFAGVTTATRTLAPPGLAATPTSGQIALTWTAPAGANTFSVYRGTAAGGEAATPLATGLTAPTYTDTALAYGTTYYYVVTATDLGGESAPSGESSAQAFGATATALASSANPAAVGAPVTFTAQVSSAGGAPAGSVQFFDGSTLLATVSLDGTGAAAYTTSALATGTHPITAAYGATTGFLASTSSAVSQTVTATHVQGVQVNDGSAQRSVVRSLTVTFDSVVTFAGAPAAAFTLTRNSDGTAVTFTATASTVGGVTVVTLDAFTGAATEFGSLADGRYTLTALSAQVTGGLAGGDSTTNLLRYYGDVNGDGVVNGLDLGFFRTAFGTAAGDPAYLAYLDYNGDGAINGLEFGQFRSRFGTALP